MVDIEAAVMADIEVEVMVVEVVVAVTEDVDVVMAAEEEADLHNGSNTVPWLISIVGIVYVTIDVVLFSLLRCTNAIWQTTSVLLSYGACSTSHENALVDLDRHSLNDIRYRHIKGALFNGELQFEMCFVEKIFWKQQFDQSIHSAGIYMDQDILVGQNFGPKTFNVKNVRNEIEWKSLAANLFSSMCNVIML